VLDLRKTILLGLTSKVPLRQDTLHYLSVIADSILKAFPVEEIDLRPRFVDRTARNARSG